MQAIGRQPQRAPNGTPDHYDRHRPEQTTLYRLVQQHAATFVAQAEDAAGADPKRHLNELISISESYLRRLAQRLHASAWGLTGLGKQRPLILPSSSMRRR